MDDYYEALRLLERARDLMDAHGETLIAALLTQPIETLAAQVEPVFVAA